MTRDEFEQQIIVKAAQDDAFRAELEKDPKGVMERELAIYNPGFTLPANLQVTLVQETPDHIYLRLPVIPAPTSEQEQVSTSGAAAASAPTYALMIDVVSAVMIDVTAATSVASIVVVVTDDTAAVSG